MPTIDAKRCKCITNHLRTLECIVTHSKCVEMHSHANFVKPVFPKDGHIYIITHFILTFWLVLAYDLLEDRRIILFSFFEFWILTNHNSLLSIATNQFASVFIDIRSRQCYFRVCQKGKIWNERAFFPCFNFLLHETNRFHVVKMW